LCGFPLRGIPQLDETLLRSRNVEGRREAIGQTVVRLLPVDQPQRHPVLIGVEVENPSLKRFHKAPLRSEEPSRRRRDAFPGRGRWKERSEEHTSELQSRENLVCRLLLEKKKEIQI